MRVIEVGWRIQRRLMGRCRVVSGSELIVGCGTFVAESGFGIQARRGLVIQGAVTRFCLFVERGGEADRGTEAGLLVEAPILIRSASRLGRAGMRVCDFAWRVWLQQGCGS